MLGRIEIRSNVKSRIQIRIKMTRIGKMVVSSVADLVCLYRIPDPTFFHPGSRIRTVSIPDPGSASKNLSVLTPQKIVSKL
jgi:hypothetical protein